MWLPEDEFVLGLGLGLRVWKTSDLHVLANDTGVLALVAMDISPKNILLMI